MRSFLSIAVVVALIDAGHIYYFDMRTRSPVRHIQLRSPTVNNLVFCNDGRLIAAGSDGTVKVFDALGQELFTIEASAPVMSAVFLSAFVRIAD